MMARMFDGAGDPLGNEPPEDDDKPGWQCDVPVWDADGAPHFGSYLGEDLVFVNADIDVPQPVYLPDPIFDPGLGTPNPNDQPSYEEPEVTEPTRDDGLDLGW